MKQINSIVAGVLLLISAGCSNSYDPRDAVKNSDFPIKQEAVQRFKAELEDLNEKSDIDVSISDSSRIVYVNEADVLNLENGIVLFGWPTCLWLRNAIEPLLEFANEKQATIYYLNSRAIRDKKDLEDGQIVTIEEGTPGYRSILEKFHGILNPYPHLGADSIKRISSPTVLFIENGQGVHKVVSTVVSHTDSHVKLNAEQREELKDRYRKYFSGEQE